MEPWLSIPEVAVRLGVSKKTAWGYVKSGKISSFKPFAGGAMRVLESELNRYVATQPKSQPACRQ